MKLKELVESIDELTNDSVGVRTDKEIKDFLFNKCRSEKHILLVELKDLIQSIPSDNIKKKWYEYVYDMISGEMYPKTYILDLRPDIYSTINHVFSTHPRLRKMWERLLNMAFALSKYGVPFR